MTLRCIGFVLRGVILLRPVPYNRDFRCWTIGRDVSCTAVVICIPLALFGAGYLLGVHTR